MKKFLPLLFLVFIFLTVAGPVVSASMDFFELDTAVTWTVRYFFPPILIVVTLLCPFIYSRYLITNEFAAKHRILIYARFASRGIIYILFASLMLSATALSLIILTNLGNSKTIQLNATIVDYYIHYHRGRTHYYISIQDPQLHRIVELSVKGPYKKGALLRQPIQAGRWGLLYSKKL